MAYSTLNGQTRLGFEAQWYLQILQRELMTDLYQLVIWSHKCKTATPEQGFSAPLISSEHCTNFE